MIITYTTVYIHIWMALEPDHMGDMDSSIGRTKTHITFQATLLVSMTYEISISDDDQIRDMCVHNTSS